MAPLSALVVVAAVVVLLVSPCVLMLCLLSERASERVGGMFGAVQRPIGRAWRAALRGPIGRRWVLVRMVRALHLPTPMEPTETVAMPIEQIAADLRRLIRLRHGVGTRSSVWYTAVRSAYDDRLRTACEQLEIPQYLGELTDIDLDLERLRVEGELRAAGLVLYDVEAPDRYRQR